MPKFFATTPRGLESVLKREIDVLEPKSAKEMIAGCSFEGSWATAYRANLELVSPSRVLYSVLDFPAYEPDQIYHNILRHDWTKYINPDRTIAVDSSVRDSKIRDLRIVALKTKDAVVDQFRNKFGKRPDVNTEDPDLQISVRLVKNQCTVSIDTSGGSLHERGYRESGGEAPLKENLAAALVRLSGWDPRSAFMDPMCGSGTLCVEAALMSAGCAPGLLRRRFGFQRWKTFQKDVYETALQQTKRKLLTKAQAPIAGSDKDQAAIYWAKRNTENARISGSIQWLKQDFLNALPIAPRGTLITNPPYGERLGASDNLADLYRQFGEHLRRHFKGWNAFILTSDRELAKALGMKPSKSFRVFNGALECQFLGFEL